MTHTPAELRKLADANIAMSRQYAPGDRHLFFVGNADAFRECADALERVQAGVTAEILAAAYAVFNKQVRRPIRQTDEVAFEKQRLRDALKAVWPVPAQDVQKVAA